MSSSTTNEAPIKKPFLQALHTQSFLLHGLRMGAHAKSMHPLLFLTGGKQNCLWPRLCRFLFLPPTSCLPPKRAWSFNSNSHYRNILPNGEFGKMISGLTDVELRGMFRACCKWKTENVSASFTVGDKGRSHPFIVLTPNLSSKWSINLNFVAKPPQKYSIWSTFFKHGA